MRVLADLGGVEFAADGGISVWGNAAIRVAELQFTHLGMTLGEAATQVLAELHGRRRAHARRVRRA